MKTPVLIAVSAAALAALVAVAAPAKPALSSIADYLPVGVASGGDGKHTTAWFLDRHNGRVVACTDRGPGGLPECRPGDLPK